MKRILFNATHPEELRIAVIDGQQLLDLDIEAAIRAEKQGNIYKGVITKVEPSLEAAFVDYGSPRQGFLPLKEIYPGYFKQAAQAGQEVVVQVEKDERGNKGAALTTYISLAGRFLVLMPNNPDGGGISRRVFGDERQDLRQVLSGLKVDKRHSIIARTACIGRTEEELQWDLDFLHKLWQTIETASGERPAPFLIHQESNLIVRSIRDHLSAEVPEVLIDDPELFNRAQRLVAQVMPEYSDRIRLYEEPVPLFSRYQVEHQVAQAFEREISLPSGGVIIIDPTEALTAIDVNSARATRGSDIEETALQTNLEAVNEIARQMRLRDLGGLIVIDLIDLNQSRHQRQVEQALKEALKLDKARTQINKISQFGLLEMSRQRRRSALTDAKYSPCPRCNGSGNIRNVVSCALQLMRLIEDQGLKESTEAMQVLVPIDTATFLINEKRREITQLEARLASRIIIVPSAELVSPQYSLRRLRGAELEELGNLQSFEQEIDHEHEVENPMNSLKTAKPEQPGVRLEQIEHAPPPPPEAPPARTAGAAAEEGSGLGIGKLWQSLFQRSQTPASTAGAPLAAGSEAPPRRRRSPTGRRRPASADAPPPRGGRGRGRRGGQRSGPPRGDRPDRGERGERGESRASNNRRGPGRRSGGRGPRRDDVGNTDPNRRPDAPPQDIPDDIGNR